MSLLSVAADGAFGDSIEELPIRHAEAGAAYCEVTLAQIDAYGCQEARKRRRLRRTSSSKLNQPI